MTDLDVLMTGNTIRSSVLRGVLLFVTRSVAEISTIANVA